MSQPFRFVHASDFHLERPLAGLADTPAHLADLMIDAPYVAAERVCNVAINQRADFLILAGDIVNADRAGPRAAAFLLDQFARLSAARIAVYWAGGRAERRGPWPAELPLPANVQRWTSSAPEPIMHHADGDALAVLVGGNRRGNDDLKIEAYPKPKGGLFAIGVAHGRLIGKRMAKSAIDYWACGGSHRRRRLSAGRATAIYSGAPQARTPADRGQHGAVVVTVDEQGVAQPTFVPTDAARYVRVRAALNVAAPRSEQERTLAECIDNERARAGGNDLFICWNLVPTDTAGPSSAGRGASRAAWADEWLAWLRREFGAVSPAAWSVSIEVEPPAAEDLHGDAPRDGSLLADFLAELAASEDSADELPLASLLPEALRSGAMAERLHIADIRQRRQVLRQAATLGRELLGAEEADPR